MTTRWIVMAMIVLAWFGVGLIFRKGRLSLFMGMEYLFVGILLAPLSLPRDAFLPLLYPFLGWIGLVIGLQLKVMYLKQLPTAVYLRAAWWTVASIAFLTLVLMVHWEVRVAVLLALALSGVSFRIVSHVIVPRGPRNRQALFLVSLLPFFLVLLFGAWLLMDGTWMVAVTWAAMTLLSGAVALGVLAVVGEKGGVELPALGLIVLISEGAAVLHVSPLVTMAVIGAWLANRSRHGDALYQVLQSDEKPLTMVFLMLTGMLAGISGNPGLLFGAVLLMLAVGLVRYLLVHRPVFGLQAFGWTPFLGPGSLAVAIGVDAWLHTGATVANGWLPPLLLAVMGLQFGAVAAAHVEETP